MKNIITIIFYTSLIIALISLIMIVNFQRNSELIIILSKVAMCSYTTLGITGFYLISAHKL